MRAFFPETPRRAAIAGGRYCAVRPVSLHQRVLVLRTRSTQNMSLLARFKKIWLFGRPKPAPPEKEPILPVVLTEITRGITEVGALAFADERRFSPRRCASDAEQAELVSSPGVDLDPVEVQNKTPSRHATGWFLRRQSRET